MAYGGDTMQEKLTLSSLRERKTKLGGVSDEQLRKDRERMSVGYMARYYGVSKSTMYRALRKAGLVDGKQS